MFWQLPAKYVTGVAAAAGIALINAMGNFAGFLGPSITGVLKDATGTYASGLWVLAAFLVLSAAGTLLIGLNLKRRDRAPAPEAVESR